MALNRTQASAESQAPTTAEVIDRLSRFDGPPEQFLVNLLAVQCYLSGANAGAILRPTQEGQIEILSLYPPLRGDETTPPAWLAQAVELAPDALNEGDTAIRPVHTSESLYGQPAERHLVMVPLRAESRVRGLATFLVEAGSRAALEASASRIEITTSLLSLYEMRLTLQRRQADMRRLRMAMETLSAVNEHDRFQGSLMALCNEISARWQCERVSVGFLRGRYVKLKGMSHTEKFSRKMTLVQDLEGAMEECLDQDIEIVHPAPDDATYVSRATAELANRHGPSAVVSLPLRRGSDVVGVLTAERRQEEPFDIEEIEGLRLTCDLATARLAHLHETDRWFGARAAQTVRKGLATFLGPKHTWVKVAAAAVLIIVLVLVFGRGAYRADAPFTMQAEVQRVVPAPFEGILKSAPAEPNMHVTAGTVLATLETAELEMQLERYRAEKLSYEKEAAAAWAEDKRNEAQAAEARAASVQAEIDRIVYRLERASIETPIDGLVVSGDWQRQVGAPVETGRTLFEVADLSSLRAELSVPEEYIADVLAAQAEADAAGEPLRGELVATGAPGREIPFIVERINPVAEVVEQENVFKVRVRLLDIDPGWMRPGLEGVAKIDIGDRSHGWLLTRKLVNWVRMKLWW